MLHRTLGFPDAEPRTLLGNQLYIQTCMTPERGQEGVNKCFLCLFPRSIALISRPKLPSKGPRRISHRGTASQMAHPDCPSLLASSTHLAQPFCSLGVISQITPCLKPLSRLCFGGPQLRWRTQRLGWCCKHKRGFQGRYR